MDQPHARPAAAHGRQIAVLYAIFLVSGFCGLIYESIWSHYLKLLLGHAAYAQAVVLVVFVGGLAAGASIAGRFSERIRQPVLWYAAIEALVAIMAFAFQGVFESVSAWSTSYFLPAFCGDGGGSCSAAWLVAAALILPPSILLGTTFPLMSAGVIRLGVAPGRGLSLLYFLNSTGAALGVLASGFLLIPTLGLPGTILLAGCCNVAVAAAAWLTVRAGQRDEAAPQAAPSRPQPAAAAGELRLLLAVAALTGLSSFIYEVVWIRMLSLVLGAATHAFELMLAPFILGLAIGAWWIRNRIDSSRDAMLLLARIQVAMGLLAVATLPLYASLYDGMAFALQALARSESGYLLFNLTSGTMAAAVMLPATVCAGMTLPLITSLLLRRGFGERQVGQVYGVNTFGAIAGVLLAVHLLIPLLGLKWALAAGAAIDVVLGIAIWRGVTARRDAGAAGPRAWAGPQLRLAGVAVVAAALLVGLTVVAPLEADRLASGVFRHGFARVRGGEVLFHRDGKTATVTVLQAANGGRSLLTNGKSDGSTHPQGREMNPDDHTMVLLGALGPAHHPTAKRAAVIGLGTGTTSAVLLGSPALQSVETIEIEPMMVEAAQLFRPRTSAVYEDPRSRIVIDDARAHFSKSGARYDIVVSEPSNPWVSGVAGLFTVEFYRHVSAHLQPDGHFVQWLHLYEAGPEMAGSIIRAFATVFPEFKAYATNGADMALVARNDGKPPMLAAGATDAMPGLRQHLRSLGIADTATLAAHETAPPSAIKLLALSYGTPANSDYFPVVDARAAQDRFEGRRAHALFALREAPVPVLEFAAPSPAYLGQVKQAAYHMPRVVRNLASAWHGRRYLQGEALAPAEHAHLENYTLDYELVRSWLAGCTPPPGTGAAWTAMVNVASDLNRGLDKAAAHAFWRSVADGPCRKAFSPVQQAWLELFAATGARDATQVRVHAARVLADDTALTQTARAYATLAGMAAHMALGDDAAASRMLRAQERFLGEAHLDTAWFRWARYALLVRDLPAEPGAKPAAARAP
ncbi:MAG: hypothetical protein ACO1PB_09035 [Ramlibacter sp.]